MPRGQGQLAPALQSALNGTGPCNIDLGELYDSFISAMGAFSEGKGKKRFHGIEIIRTTKDYKLVTNWSAWSGVLVYVVLRDPTNSFSDKDIRDIRRVLKKRCSFKGNDKGQRIPKGQNMDFPGHNSILFQVSAYSMPRGM